MSVNLSRRSFVSAVAGSITTFVLTACGNSTTGNEATEPTAGTVAEPFGKLAETDGNFAYNAAEDGVEYHYSNVLSPNYYVFAGAMDADGAAALVGELGLADSIETYVGSVTVVNPADGSAYTTADADAFVELAAAAGPANNVKVIGIDEGADFVLGALAPKLYFVAGVMTFGGTEADAAGVPFVPAYLCNAPQAAVTALIAANGAEQVAEGVYENPGDSLRRVVEASDADLGLRLGRAHGALRLPLGVLQGLLAINPTHQIVMRATRLGNRSLSGRTRFASKMTRPTLLPCPIRYGLLLRRSCNSMA